MARNTLEDNIDRGIITIGNAIELCEITRRHILGLIKANSIDHMQMPGGREYRVSAMSLHYYCHNNNIWFDQRLVVAARNYYHKVANNTTQQPGNVTAPLYDVVNGQESLHPNQLNQPQHTQPNLSPLHSTNAAAPQENPEPRLPHDPVHATGPDSYLLPEIIAPISIKPLPPPGIFRQIPRHS